MVSLLEHELRTPLTTILGYLEMVMDGEAGALNDAQARFLQSAKSSAERLSALTGELGEVAHIELGRTQLDLQRVDITNLVDEVVDTLAKSTGNVQPLLVVRRLSRTIPKVHADPHRLMLILTDLLTRANRYASSQGTVEIALSSAAPMVVVEFVASRVPITDNEPLGGRDAKRNAQLDRTELRDLRLEMARVLIERQGGTASFTESEAGARLRFSLPAAPAQSTEG